MSDLPVFLQPQPTGPMIGGVPVGTVPTVGSSITPIGSPSGATIGGVPIPQQVNQQVAPDLANIPAAEVKQLVGPPASLANPVVDTSGGTDPSSLLNSPPTSDADKKAAIDGGTTQKVFQIMPTEGAYISTVAKVATNAVLADWYRNGKPETDTESGKLPLSIEPFEHQEKAASIRVFGLQKQEQGGNAKKDVELIPAYTKFLLEGVNEQHTERSQIVETFGDFYVFFFGERPPMYSFTGTLINTKNYNWVADFKFYYDAYLRGSKCVESSARLILTYGGRQIEGFMMGMQTMTDASMEAGVKVSFNVVVTRKTFLSFSEDFGNVTQNGKQFTDKTFKGLIDKIAGANGGGLSDPATSDAHAKTANVMADNLPPVGTMETTSFVA